MSGCSGPLRMGRPCRAHAAHRRQISRSGQPPWRRWNLTCTRVLHSYPIIDLGRGVLPPKRAAARVRQLPPLELWVLTETSWVALTASAWPRIHEYGRTGRYYVAVTAIDDHF